MNENYETILRLQEALTRFAKAEWRQKPFNGLTRSDIRILYCIMECEASGSPKPRISDISKRLLVTTPTVTQLIKKLIDEGLIERTVDPDDRRSVGIALTEKGKAVAKEADALIKQKLGGLVDFLGVEESEKLAELMTKAFHYYHNPDESKT